MPTNRSLSLLLSLFLATCQLLAVESPIELAAADGSLKTPLVFTPDNQTKFAVLIFYLHDCPICNAYAPEIERLRADFEPKGFAFYIVQTDAAVTAATAAKHASDYNLKGSILLDPTNRLAQKFGATITPQVAIVGPNDHLHYLGRIDNLYADYGKRRPDATVHDLRAALTALASGTPAPAAQGPPVGCFIPLPKRNEAKKP